MDLMSEILGRWKQKTSYNDPLSKATGEAASAYYNSGDQLREKYKHIFDPVEQASLVAKEREGLGKSFYGAQEMAGSRQEELSSIAQAIAQGIQEEEARKQAERDYQLQLRATELQERLTRAQIEEMGEGSDEDEDFRKENAFLKIDQEINGKIADLITSGTIPSKAINQTINSYYNALTTILPFGKFATPEEYSHQLKVRLCAKAAPEQIGARSSFAHNIGGITDMISNIVMPDYSYINEKSLPYGKQTLRGVKVFNLSNKPDGASARPYGEYSNPTNLSEQHPNPFKTPSLY